MKKRNRNIFEIKRGILKCKKRLDALKNQGFIFSQDIYDNLDSLEKKIIGSSLIRQIWNKKLPLFAGIICIMSIIIAIALILSENGEMELTIKNLPGGTIIEEDYCIRGSANHSNGAIVSVLVKIDNGNWDHAEYCIETLEWEYWIYIDDLSEETHNLSFRCWDGEKYSDIKKIKIQKPRIVKPVVAIHTPLDGNETLYGIVIINGTATAENGEIQRVEIRFNEGQWINVNFTGKTTWQYTWDTTHIENEFYNISARSYDNKSPSEIFKIRVTVNNGDGPDTIVELPSFYDGGYFQFYIDSIDNEKMIPGETYELQGFHSRKLEPKLFWQLFTIKTILEVDRKPAWLNVSLPNQPLVTPPDGELYTFSISISITNNASRNAKAPLTFTATYGIALVMDYQFFARSRKEIPLEIFVSTGEW